MSGRRTWGEIPLFPSPAATKGQQRVSPGHHRRKTMRASRIPVGSARRSAERRAKRTADHDRRRRPRRHGRSKSGRPSRCHAEHGTYPAFILQWDENFDIGADTGTHVDEEDQVPFAFKGTVDKLTLTIDGPKLSPTDIQKLQEASGTTKSANQTTPNHCWADRQIAQLFRSTEVHPHGGAITSESDTVYSIPPTVCLNPALGHGSELGGR